MFDQTQGKEVASRLLRKRHRWVVQIHAEELEGFSAVKEW
jgi:hypothetical protein